MRLKMQSFVIPSIFPAIYAFNSVPGSTCGVANSGARIVGGQQVDNAEHFPWQARFQACFLAAGSCGLCGATIISDRWLVTAAHCTKESDPAEDADPASSTVRVGQIQNSQSSAQGTLYLLSAIINHPDYNPNDISDGADITLLLTQTAMALSSTVHPACLPQNNLCLEYGSDVYVSGYGTTSSGGSLPSNLRWVDVKIVSWDDCSSSYGNGRSYNLTCAGFDQGGKDSCQGDSGGPLVAKISDVYYLYGVVSYGSGCAAPDYYGVYSTVTAHLRWIMLTTADVYAYMGVGQFNAEGVNTMTDFTTIDNGLCLNWHRDDALAMERLGTRDDV